MATETAPEKSTDIARQGGTVAFMTLLSRVSGLVRDIALSYLFGASQYADMFFVALRIPNFFRRLFAEGAFNQAFVPVMVRYRDYGTAELNAFLRPLFGLFSLSLLVFVVLGVIFAKPMTALFAPGFIGREDQFAETVELVRITFPYLGFVSLVAYAGALLNAHGRFAIPAFTPVLLNLCLIGAALLALGSMLDTPTIEILAWGVFVAGVVQLAFQIPQLNRLQLIVRPSFNHRHEGIRQVGKLLVPAVLAGSVSQVNALVNTILASTLVTGSISWLYYADRLLELPIGLVAVALGTVMLPHLTRLANATEHHAFELTVSWGVRLGLVLGLPAAVAMYCLADGLIATIFLTIGGTAMSHYDAVMAGYALQMFAVALPGFVLVRVLSPAFYAHENTQAPFRYAAVAIGVNLVGSLATYRWFGHVGLAWATALSAWTNVLLLHWGLKKHGLYHVDGVLLRALLAPIAASTLLGFLLWWSAAHWHWLDMAAWTRVVAMGGVVVAGVLVYAALLFAFGMRWRDFRHDSAIRVE